MTPDLVNFPLVNEYAGNKSGTYNKGLREDSVSTDLKSKEEQLNLELDKLEPYANKMAYAHDTLTHIPFDILSKWYLKRIGHIVEFPNFLSSSDHRWTHFILPDYKNTVYEIRTSDKSKARHIYPVVCKKTEKEVLFKSKALFQIQRVDVDSRTVHLNEVQEENVKITLNKGVFLLDNEIKKLIKPSKNKGNNSQLSASDLGLC